MIFRYFRILSQRNFFLLWMGQIISQFGDRLTQIALVALASKTSMSSSSLAAIMSMAVIPVFIISPLSGVYIDRWSKRKTMCTSDCIRGIFILLIPLCFLSSKTLLPIYVLLFLSFSAGRFFIPAKMAYIPQIIRSRDIFMANSLISITATIAAVLGIGLGAIIVEKYGIKIAFGVDAATFFISAAAIFFIRQKENNDFNPKDILDIGKNVVSKVKTSFVRELGEGIRYIFTEDETKYAVKIFFFLFSYVGGLYVVLIRFIQLTLHSITRDLGFTAVAMAGGLFSGSLIYGRIAHKFSIHKLVNMAILISSLFLIFFVVFLNCNPFSHYAVMLSFIFGALISPAFIGVNALIHKESDANLLGRIFSGLEFTSHFGFLVAMFTASFLADIFTPFTIVIVIGIIGVFCSLMFMKKQ